MQRGGAARALRSPPIAVLLLAAAAAALLMRLWPQRWHHQPDASMAPRCGSSAMTTTTTTTTMTIVDAVRVQGQRRRTRPMALSVPETATSTASVPATPSTVGRHQHPAGGAFVIVSPVATGCDDDATATVRTLRPPELVRRTGWTFDRDAASAATGVRVQHVR